MENTEQSLEKTDDNYKVPNLEKGIAVIEYLSSRSEGETLQAIKVALDISQTTAYRILNTLVRLDYLSFDEDTKRYKLTRKLLTLGFRSLNEHNLLETVLPHLRDLRDRVKETACFGVLGDEKGIFIEQARGDHAFCFVLSPGKPFELHCSAPGKAIMAYLPVTVRNRYLSYMTFPRYNSRTITSREVYLEELEKVYQQGLCRRTCLELYRISLWLYLDFGTERPFDGGTVAKYGADCQRDSRTNLSRTRI